MAAAFNVSHNKIFRNFDDSVASSTIAVPRCGVVTLFGFGISVRVDKGHLLLEDGIGAERRTSRFSRVGHGLRRLVVIGSDGMVSLAALRWLADQGAAFVMLDRDGTVLATTGPVRPSDARLRRAQALATQNRTGLEITRELISQKLAGQEWLVRNKLARPDTADKIESCRASLDNTETYDQIRQLESRGAAAYWSAWRDIPINFPRNDLKRVPAHWLTFGTRKSPLTGSARLAANPPNAMLNYLYALLESESRLGLAALGLDPGMGFLHLDTSARDSLACDLMEAVRPEVDAFVLDWILRVPLRRDSFFEQRDGNCRLMASVTSQLTETCTAWGRSVAPIAEWIAKHLGLSSAKTAKLVLPARLTQRSKREAKGITSANLPEPKKICLGCGSPLIRGKNHCFKCGSKLAAKRMVDVARVGRITAQNPHAQTKRSETQRRNEQAKRAWLLIGNPSWLTEAQYKNKIQPLLTALSNSSIASALEVSLYYAADIRRGRVQPHPRHWRTLAELTGVCKV